MSTDVALPNLRALAKTGNGTKLIDIAMMPVTAARPLMGPIKRLDQGLVTAGGWQKPPIVEGISDALIWASRFPTFEALATAANSIRAALVEPLPIAATHVMVASLIDGIGRKLPDKPEPYIAALVDAVDAASDEMAYAMGWWPTIPHPVSRCVLALAIKTLRATKVFNLAPSELTEACVDAYRNLAVMAHLLHDFAEARGKIDDMIRAQGVEHHRDIALRVPANRAPVILSAPIKVARRAADSLGYGDPKL